MSVRINKDNYEEFYLDYLEGNLSGDLLSAFEMFLEQHPELIVEDESLVNLTPDESETFDAIEKLLLKTSINIADLSKETISFFLIAREENLLSQHQVMQIENWLTANAHYRTDAALFHLAKVQPDTTIVFEEKSSLKRRQARVIPMWFTGAAVAAGLALIITLAIPNRNEQIPPTDTLAHINILPIESNTTQHQETRLQQNQSDHKVVKQQTTLTESQPKTAGTGLLIYKNKRRETTPIAIASLEKRDSGYEQLRKEGLVPLSISDAAAETFSPVETEDRITWVPVEEMNNPIRMVTSKLSDKFNTIVDFRMAKPTLNRSGGFLVQIGDMQILHRSVSH